MKPKKIIIFIDEAIEDEHKKDILHNLEVQMNTNQYELTCDSSKAHIGIYQKEEVSYFPTTMLAFSIYNPKISTHNIFQNTLREIIDFIKLSYLLIHRHDALASGK
jgi:hypothetical protein